MFAVTLHHRAGAVDRVLGAARRQGCTAIGIAFGQTEHPAVDRLTLTFVGGNARRLHGQLTRMVDVIAVVDFSARHVLVRETALLRLAVPPERRAAAESIAAAFGGRIVDHDDTSLLLEIAGEPQQVDACIAASHVLGVQQVARGGRLAVERLSRNPAATASSPFHHQADGMSEHFSPEH